MKAKVRQSGISLTEMTVVVAAVALLASLSAPAVRTFFDSLASRDSARAMIGASLSAARAIAAKERRYAGIRFQKAWHPLGPLYSRQYMIFIINDFERTGLAHGFRVVEGIKPIKLPENLRVMDFTIVTNRDLGTTNYNEVRLDDPLLASDQKDSLINDNNSLGFRDTTTFSIIFSPSGKMVIHGVRIRNRDGVPRWPSFLDNSNDDVFNTITRITDPLNPAGMFLQDDYWNNPNNLGLGPELSRRGFVIYERDKFQQALNRGLPYSGYLEQLVVPVPQAIYINPYTGRIIR
jgi:type II secretory pathway pseudopilin PulG